MNYLTKEFAEKQAAEDFVKYCAVLGPKALTLPIDPDRLAEVLWGTRVVYLKEGELPGDAIAFADLKDNQIVIESSGYEQRDRFSVAHEVGHFSLHKYLVDLNEVDSKNKRFHESQADAYASVLLMPKEMVLRCVRENSGMLSDDSLLIMIVSEKFFVSKKAAEIRLKSLGLIKNDNMSFIINKRETEMQYKRDNWKQNNK